MDFIVGLRSLRQFEFSQETVEEVAYGLLFAYFRVTLETVLMNSTIPKKVIEDFGIRVFGNLNAEKFCNLKV